MNGGGLLALVDADAFYASCERVFRPDWAARPLAVLAYDDGIVIARCRRARALGVAVGDYYPSIRRDFERAGGVVRASNFALYGDLSARMMETLATFSPDREVYSIDEVFLQLGGAPGEARPCGELGGEIRARVWRWTGLPVSVGIAPTKTLAKLAVETAKENGIGVASLATPEEIAEALAATPVEGIWGIARRAGRRLRARMIRTAADLAASPERVVDAALGLSGLRIQAELRGVPSLPLASAPPPRKSALTSRTFGRAILDRAEMREAVASFAVRAARKARAAGCATGGVGVFLEPRDPSGSPPVAASLALAVPTSATGEILRAAAILCDRLFREGAAYRRAGVHLWGLVPAAPRTGDLFFDEEAASRTAALDRVVDRLNDRFGAGAVRPAACGVAPLARWRASRDLRSPCYTTAWRELAVARGSMEFSS